MSSFFDFWHVQKEISSPSTGENRRQQAAKTYHKLMQGKTRRASAPETLTRGPITLQQHPSRLINTITASFSTPVHILSQ